MNPIVSKPRIEIPQLHVSSSKEKIKWARTIIATHKPAAAHDAARALSHTAAAAVPRAWVHVPAAVAEGPARTATSLRACAAGRRGILQVRLAEGALLHVGAGAAAAGWRPDIRIRFVVVVVGGMRMQSFVCIRGLRARRRRRRLVFRVFSLCGFGSLCTRSRRAFLLWLGGFVVWKKCLLWNGLSMWGWTWIVRWWV